MFREKVLSVEESAIKLKLEAHFRADATHVGITEMEL